MTTPTPRGSLWTWSVEAYGRPGVAEACLALQDEHGQSVPMLLWAAWTQFHGRTPALAEGAAIARAWEDEVVGPLRRLRRMLKAATPDQDREAVREQLKAVELDAERRLLQALERTHAVSDATTETLPELLSQASVHYRRPLPPPAFESLARTLNPDAV